MTSHQDGIVVARAIAREFGVEWAELRAFASEYLARQYNEQGITDADIGSSDVSIKLADLANYSPQLLREEAERLKERNELVARVAASTGRSEVETLTNLRRLLAPIDEED